MKNTHNEQSNNTLIQLDNGKAVPPEILELVQLVVEDRIPNLSSDKAYTLRGIFGEKEWNYFNLKNKFDAGYCMVHLVGRGVLPMISANECKHQSPKRYRLK